MVGKQRRVLQLERIRTVAELDRARDAWHSLYAADPGRHLFLSWSWLRAYLPAGRYRWSVLALRDGEELIAVLPLALSGFPTPGLSIDRELHLGANPAGDYTGMLCRPEREEEALDAFAAAVAEMGWENFNLADTVGPRMQRLARRIAQRVAGSYAELSREACHAIALPESWERYLAENLNAKSRKNTLRAMRRIAELPGYRITEATASDVDLHLDAVLALKQARFGGNLGRLRARYARFFRNCFETGTLRIFAMWDGERPISAAAVFVDRETRTFCSYMRGHAAAYAGLGPGRAMVGHLIKRAIEEGYARFDFLRGGETYKLDFTNTVTVTCGYRVTRPGLRATLVNRLRPAFFALKLRLANVAFGGGRSL